MCFCQLFKVHDHIYCLLQYRENINCKQRLRYGQEKIVDIIQFSFAHVYEYRLN